MLIRKLIENYNGIECRGVWMKSLSVFAITIMLLHFLCCCTTHMDQAGDHALRNYDVYVINRGIHTGLVIPVNTISKRSIDAMGEFPDATFVDFGWGDEEVYQTPDETLCMDIRAVLIPSSSVMCARAIHTGIGIQVERSDFAVRFMLAEDEFTRLCMFINSSFTRDGENRLIKTSVRSGGNIIYFRSIHTYCLFNTCNTWIADALSLVVPGVSPFMVITRDNLYDEIRDRGELLKKK